MVAIKDAGGIDYFLVVFFLTCLFEKQLVLLKDKQGGMVRDRLYGCSIS